MIGDVKPGIDGVNISQILCALVVMPVPWCPPPGLSLFLHGSLGQAGLGTVAYPALSQRMLPVTTRLPLTPSPLSDGKKQVKALVSMGSKYSPHTQGDEAN